MDHPQYRGPHSLHRHLHRRGRRPWGGQDYRFAILVFAITLAISLPGLIYSVYTKRHSLKSGPQKKGLETPNKEGPKVEHEDFLFLSAVWPWPPG